MITHGEVFAASTFKPLAPMPQERFGNGFQYFAGTQLVITELTIPQTQQITHYIAALPGASSVEPTWDTCSVVRELADLNLNDATLFVEPGRFPTNLAPAFQELVEKWYEERKNALSSMAEMIACPSYLRIIGFGPKVFPLIIKQLKREGDKPDHWCAALEAVTGENPVPEDAHGNTAKIAKHWIAWHTDPTRPIFLDSPEEITG